METEEEFVKHESFGQIRFSRVSGHANFYGSELTQNHFITMEIDRSEIRRELGKDWYHTMGAPVVSIRMSSGQFAELITTLNNGSGVPCTLEVIDGKEVPKLPVQESRKEFMHRKFRDRMLEFSKSIKERQTKATQIVKKKVLSKQDVLNFTHHLEWLTGEVDRNIPFFMECFQETMDEVVLEAKTEVENAIQHKINVLGLKKLKKEKQYTPYQLKETIKRIRKR